MEEILKWIVGVPIAVYFLIKAVKEVIILTPSKKDDEFFNDKIVRAVNIGLEIGANYFKIENLKDLGLLKPIPKDDVE